MLIAEVVLGWSLTADEGLQEQRAEKNMPRGHLLGFASSPGSLGLHSCLTTPTQQLLQAVATFYVDLYVLTDFILTTALEVDLVITSPMSLMRKWKHREET